MVGDEHLHYFCIFFCVYLFINIEQAGEKRWMLVDSCANIGRASVAWQESRPHIAGLYQGLMRPLAQPDLYTLDQHVCANLKPSTDTGTDRGDAAGGPSV